MENINFNEPMIINQNDKISNNNYIPKLNINSTLNLENNDLIILNQPSDSEIFDIHSNPSSPNESPLTTPRSFSLHSILFITHGYYFIKSIAKGGYGEVFLAITKSDKLFAIKVINKCDTIEKDMVEELMVERNILSKYQNQSIVKLYECFQTNEQLFMVMEFLHGGDCASLLQSLVTFKEHDAKNIIAQIVNGLEFIHSCGIIHRDLKLDNLIFDRNGIIKIVDFGLSEIGFIGNTIENNKLNKKCLGTPYYMAPEVINNTGYGKTIDWWALGIIIFEMLSGETPFVGDSQPIIFKNITQHNNEIICPTDFSKDATDLIQKLLQVDPSKRLGANGADEVKNHPFFNGIKWNSIYSPESLTFKPRIEKELELDYFIERKIIKKTVLGGIKNKRIINRNLFIGFDFKK
ncbi:hypothetical protein ACTFIZ_008768 [Dictyostelium cf. discoideum]